MLSDQCLAVSVIAAVKNESATIGNLIHSLLSQSRKASEIIIVDGGSTDGTADIINSFIEKGVPIRLITQQDANSAKGRNIAIGNARHEYIASIDAGCRADQGWLENLVKFFENEPSADVVFGTLLSESKSWYEECVSELLYPKLKIINWDNFLPGGANIAFKKSCWREVGGFPEWSEGAEDVLFDLKLRGAGYKFYYAEDAIVYWRPRANLWGLFKQYYSYARGSAQADFTSPFLFEAYGRNVLSYLFWNMIDLVRRGRLIPLSASFIILPTVLLAKLLGGVAGKLAGRQQKTIPRDGSA